MIGSGWIRAIRGAWVLVGLCAGLAAASSAAEPEPNASTPADLASSPAAQVDNYTITEGDVDARLRELAGGVDSPSPERRRAALEHLIDQRLVLRYLESTGQALSDAEVELQWNRLRDDLRRQMRSLDVYLAGLGLTDEQFRFRLRWRGAWSRFLEARLTEENVNRYFERRRREFDGTRLRVAHVLLTGPRDEATEQAVAIRRRLEAGEIAFDEAARRHSQSPSGAEGGDIGWITRHQPMPEAFSSAAYRLRLGQVSEPVVSPFGVHLITVLEEVPGSRSLDEARAEVSAAMARDLFDWAAARRGPHSTVVRLSHDRP